MVLSGIPTLFFLLGGLLLFTSILFLTLHGLSLPLHGLSLPLPGLSLPLPFTIFVSMVSA
jgi:hypothetical protein